jgi:hypothetical protein
LMQRKVCKGIKKKRHTREDEDEIGEKNIIY